MYKLAVILTNIIMTLSYNEADAYDCRIQRLCDGLTVLSTLTALKVELQKLVWSEKCCYVAHESSLDCVESSSTNTPVIHSCKTILLLENSARSLRLLIINAENKTLPFLGRWLHLTFRKVYSSAHCPLHQAG